MKAHLPAISLVAAMIALGSSAVTFMNTKGSEPPIPPVPIRDKWEYAMYIAKYGGTASTEELSWLGPNGEILRAENTEQLAKKMNMHLNQYGKAAVPVAFFTGLGNQGWELVQRWDLDFNSAGTLEKWVFRRRSQ